MKSPRGWTVGSAAAAPRPNFTAFDKYLLNLPDEDVGHFAEDQVAAVLETGG
jgi:hypothetical protein